MRPIRWLHKRFLDGWTRRLPALMAAGLVVALVAGCAQAPPAGERDLNAEAMRQMGYWGGEPGF